MKLEFPVEDVVDQLVARFQPARVLGQVQDDPPPGAAEDGAASEDEGSQRCRLAITRQAGGALELAEQVEQQQDGLEGGFGGVLCLPKLLNCRWITSIAEKSGQVLVRTLRRHILILSRAYALMSGVLDSLRCRDSAPWYNRRRASGCGRATPPWLSLVT